MTKIAPTYYTVQGDMEGLKHSEAYNELGVKDKEKVDAIIAYLSGDTIVGIKNLLSICRRELDFRGSLGHQPSPQGHLSGN